MVTSRRLKIGDGIELDELLPDSSRAARTNSTARDCLPARQLSVVLLGLQVIATPDGLWSLKCFGLR